MEYDCIISHEGDEKYVIVKVINKMNKKEKLMLVSHKVFYHVEIVQKIEKNLTSLEKLEILGGGLLKIDKNKKTIYTYGTSGSYGPPSLKIVETILKNVPHFKNYQLELTISVCKKNIFDYL